MPVITVHMLEGRTAAQKATLIADLADTAKRTLDVPDDPIRVLLIEMPPEHWGVGGRSMAQIRPSRPNEPDDG